jgi:hypothetical protein
MNDFAHRQLILHGFMDTLTLEPKTRGLIKREWMLEDEEIEACGLKSPPSLVFNLILSAEISKQIGFPSGGIKETFWSGNMWLLDVDERFARTGVIMPVFYSGSNEYLRLIAPRTDPAARNIKALQVWRHVRDQRPFFVNSRNNFERRGASSEALPASA